MHAWRIHGIHPYTRAYIFVSSIFDALAQGNAYKPTKEPISYRGPGRDRTNDLQTKATPSPASCPVRSLYFFMPLKLCKKNTTPKTCPRLHWTSVNPSGMHRCQYTYIRTYARTHACTHTYMLNAGFQARKSETTNRQLTECPLTNRVSHRGSSRNPNSTTRAYDEWAFSPIDFPVDWFSHLALAICMSITRDGEVIMFSLCVFVFVCLSRCLPGRFNYE